MCRVSEIGKTTSADAPGFNGVSIDETLWAWCGRAGIDYPRRTEIVSVQGDLIRTEQNVVIRLQRLARDRRDMAADLPQVSAGSQQDLLQKRIGQIRRPSGDLMAREDTGDFDQHHMRV